MSLAVKLLDVFVQRVSGFKDVVAKVAHELRGVGRYWWRVSE